MASWTSQLLTTATLTVALLGMGCRTEPSPSQQGALASAPLVAAFTPEEAARICMTRVTCGLDHQLPGFSGVVGTCTTFDVGALVVTPLAPMTAINEALYRCILEAGTDCAAASACATGVNCADPTPAEAAACAAYGGQCYSGAHHTLGGTRMLRSGCVSQLCQDPCTTAHCTGRCGYCHSYCSGDLLISSAPHRGECTITDCAALGATCENVNVAPNYGARCVTPRQCPVTNSYCDGDTLVTCDDDLRENSRTDCTAQPVKKRCVHLPGRVDATCEPTGTACSYPAPDSCSGSSVLYCFDGFVRTFDCLAEGFGPCDASTGHCTLPQAAP